MTTQTDQELLEYAALAAGLENPEFHGGEHLEDRYGFSIAIWSDSFGGYWNSLESSAHAFWLAQKLVLDVEFNDDSTNVGYWDGEWRTWVDEYFKEGDDPIAASCRAITRAAAAIGQSMKEQGK